MKTLKITLAMLCFAAITIATSANATNHRHIQIATFAGGCFWCMQADFDKVNGVQKTLVGYTGGHTQNPSYEQVSSGTTGHYEAINVYYNTKVVSYRKLLSIFWRNIDPTDAKGQFCDKGSSYRAAIFYHDKTQQKLAMQSKQALIESGRFRKVVTPVLAAKKFYSAEEYHQEYYQKNPLRYKFYRYRCQRDHRLKMLWEDAN